MTEQINTPIFWFTGLPSSGKTVLADRLYKYFLAINQPAKLLDSDLIRKSLSSDLGFTDEDRSENARRAAVIAETFASSEVIPIVALITPFEHDRQRAREIVGDHLHEIYVECDIETCVKRDSKGLYKQAINNEIDLFTGVTSDYEIPMMPDITINTTNQNVNDSFKELMTYVKNVLNNESTLS